MKNARKQWNTYDVFCTEFPQHFRQVSSLTNGIPVETIDIITLQTICSKLSISVTSTSIVLQKHSKFRSENKCSGSDNQNTAYMKKKVVLLHFGIKNFLLRGIRTTSIVQKSTNSPRSTSYSNSFLLYRPKTTTPVISN